MSSEVEDNVKLSDENDTSSSSDPNPDGAQQPQVSALQQSLRLDCLGSRFNMGLDRNTVSQEAITISSNGRRMVECFEVADHLVAPNYPATSLSGILHFVHFPGPLVSADSTKDAIKEEFARIQSRIQISTKILGNISKTSLQLLSPRRGTNETAWRATYKCTGIYHCKYTHPDILSTCAAYDRPKIETINSLRKRSGRQI